MILKYLKANWFLVGAALLVAALAWRLDTVTGQRDAARATATSLQTKVDTLGQQIDRQNAGIRALVQQRDEDRKTYLEGLRAANQRAVKLEVSAERILSLPEPAPDKACEAAEALLRKELAQ